MARRIDGMVCVITGASAGIGAELARQLSAKGAKLVLSARRLDRLQTLNTQLGGQHLCVQADVSKQEDCKKLIEQSVGQFGRIDTLVCNAGYGIYTRVGETTPEQMREIFATNVLGTTDCIRYASPHLIGNPLQDGWRGQVMIVSSVVGRRGVPFLGAYSATKAAQLMLAESLRVEMKEHQIGVTSVHPIMTRTEFGSAAEQKGAIQLPKSDRDRWTQPVEHVGRRMVRAIERPVPEVWPSRPSRWLIGLGTLIPGVVDLGMGRYYRQVVAANHAK